MKKIFSLTLALLMAALTLTACGGNGAGSSAGPDADAASRTFQTLGEVLDLEIGSQASSYNDGKYILAFETGGAYYRVIADMSEELSDELWALDYNDPDYEQKQYDMLAPLTVTRTDYLNDQMLTDDQIKALVGKTGADLLNDGWTCWSGYDLSEMKVWMDYGPFTYSVYFDADGSAYNTDTFDVEEDIKELTVKNIELSMLGDKATELEPAE